MNFPNKPPINSHSAQSPTLNPLHHNSAKKSQFISSSILNNTPATTTARTQRFVVTKDYQLFRSQLAGNSVNRQPYQNQPQKQQQRTVEFSQSKRSRFTEDITANYYNSNNSESFNRMENFYLPIMRQVYNQNREKIQGKVKPPEQLFKKVALLEATTPKQLSLLDMDQRKTIENLKKQVQNKDLKIKQLQIKCSYLFNKLKLFVAEQQIQFDSRVYDNTNSNIQQYEKKIKRLQNLLRIKNQEVFFRIKVQASNLLQQFGVEKADIGGMNQLQNQNAIFEFLINKLKIKLKDLKVRQRQTNQQQQKDRLLHEKNSQVIHFLTQTNELLKNSQIRTKHKLQQLKNQWQKLYEKLSLKQQIIEQKETQIFKQKKLNEQSQTQILKLQSNQRNLHSQIQTIKKQNQQTIKQLRSLLTKYNLEQKQFINKLNQKQQLISECMIRAKYCQQECDKLQRENVRWKQRYDWLQNEKNNKVANMQDEIKRIQLSQQDYRNQFNIEVVNDLNNEIGKLVLQLQEVKQRVQVLIEQVNYQKGVKQQLQQRCYNQLQHMQNDYKQKIGELNRKHEQEIKKEIEQKQYLVIQKYNQYKKNQQIRMQQLEAIHVNKYYQLQGVLSQTIKKLQTQNQSFKDKIQELIKKVQDKDKLIVLLYPGMTDLIQKQSKKQLYSTVKVVKPSDIIVNTNILHKLKQTKK